jgi:hypothetical protein
MFIREFRDAIVGGKNEGLISRGKGSPQKFKVSTGIKGLVRKIVVKQEL